MKIKQIIFGMAAVALTACSGNGDSKADSAKDAATESYDQIEDEKNSEKQADETPVAPKGEVKVVTSADEVVEKPSRPVFVDFNATWCGPCQQFAPVFDAAAAKYGDKADFLSVDVDELPALAEKYQVRNIPMILCIMPNGEVTKSVGFMDSRQFNEFVEFHFEK